MSTGTSNRSPRPKRNQTRPNYRIPTMAELEASSSSPTAPTDPPPSEPTQKSNAPPASLTRKAYESITPQFVVFHYEWKSCKAELINMPTLIKHITKVHSMDAYTDFRCQWGKCGQYEPGQVNDPAACESLHALDKHVYERHLVSYVWHMGDGIGSCLGGVVKQDESVDSPRYLFHDGVQVTPSAKDLKLQTEKEQRERVEKMKVTKK